MKSLSQLIDREILILIPFIHDTDLQVVKLIAVESGGIWIQNEQMTQRLLANLKLHAGKTPIFFVPFSQVLFVMDASEEVSLSEKAFGL
jgi:hypothetical protein